jgi:hypothetical protein
VVGDPTKRRELKSLDKRGSETARLSLNELRLNTERDLQATYTVRIVMCSQRFASYSLYIEVMAGDSGS